MGRDIQYFWEGERTLCGWTLHFIGELDNHLETMLCYLALIGLSEAIYKKKDIKDHI